MYTSKSVSQRSAIFNPEEIRTDRVFVQPRSNICQGVSVQALFAARNVLRPKGWGSRIHSPFFNISESEFHADHRRFAFSVRRFSLWRVCEKLHFRTRFQGIRFDGYLLVKKNRSESWTFDRAPQTAPDPPLRTKNSDRKIVSDNKYP